VIKLKGDTGLAAMVDGARADPNGHLVLADWIEEHLELSRLASVLRHSKADPREAGAENHTAFSDFRYCRLDDQVILYLSSYRVWRGSGQGRVVGFCLSPQSPVGPGRWVRWLPAGAGEPAEQVLWEELATGLPAAPKQGP
jgi:hypothetical protein